MNKLIRFLRDEEKKPWVIVAQLLLLLVAIQCLYPESRLLPFMSIDGQSLSAWNKTDAASVLDDYYDKLNVPIFIGQSTDAYKTVALRDTGVDTANASRLAAVSYPWYLRLVPSSLFWGHLVVGSGQPSVSVDEESLKQFMAKELNAKSCFVEPKNAGIHVDGVNLVVDQAVNGGACSDDDIKSAFANFNPFNNDSVRVPVKEAAPDVATAIAQQLADELNRQLGAGVNVSVAGSMVQIPRDKLVSWLEFQAKDKSLEFSFSSTKAYAYLNEQIGGKVKVEATTTTIKTTDFVETSRVNGRPGQQLDVAATLQNIKLLLEGKATTAAVAVERVASPIEYKRSYTNTNIGMLALMQNFASSHKGTYGITLVELSGQHRTASYNGGKQFVTASIYKLFVAYSTLLRVDRGTWKLTDTITGGKNLATCFDDMIVVSDNTCAMALLKKVGYSTITNEMRALGLSSTSFMGENIMTAPQDVASLLTALARGEILSKASRDRWIGAMKRNVYRQGIPSGTGSVVADKVGFLWELLHDAGIVYSSRGTYVLVVMTDKSSWSNIADLTHQLDRLASG